MRLSDNDGNQQAETFLMPSGHRYFSWIELSDQDGADRLNSLAVNLRNLPGTVVPIEADENDLKNPDK
jgi:hypothetical protein